MKETLGYLTKLQDTDKKLFYLEFSKGDLPRTVAKLKEEIKELEDFIQQAKKDIEIFEKERRNTEGLVALARDKLKKYQNQLYDVTSNKEYDAITQEIDIKKREIDEGELQILEYDQEKENREERLGDAQDEKELKQSELGIKEKELSLLLHTTEQQEAELMHAREKITVRLKPNVLRMYERIRKAKNGIAVVPVTRDACGGCYKTIPPQKIVEIEKLQELIQCEVCGRILIPEHVMKQTSVV